MWNSPSEGEVWDFKREGGRADPRCTESLIEEAETEFDFESGTGPRTRDR